ncbi:diguanylate cyclase [Neptuniibacter sp.]|uniref:GGDEF domain-containing response regulator n=1 Tax=Neptuniibacter sp. TaxID=1962643 RepID=UPI00263685CB|nr:diguanylate cyclase [Neptuniibacter sp.]MCP4595637.1 diguanylate cyclase [Neptuniibacter sp.]
MNILVVDDDRFIREIVSAVIQDADHSAVTASNDLEALEALEQGDIDLILMDVEMPGRNGFELTQAIRELYSKHWFPIIFLSAASDEQHYEKGINAGGDDYLPKPVSPIILRAKIRAMERIANMKKELDDANTRLEKLSSQDPLTKLSNRRDLEVQLLKEWKRSHRDAETLSAIMLDIDFFKPYNDNYGHQQGDECLKSVAKILKGSLSRSHDIIARYGGEEFAIILPDTSYDGAKKVAENIIKMLAENKLPHEYSNVADHVTASIGISSTYFNPITPNALLQQADQALYKAKENGRNRYEVFSP